MARTCMKVLILKLMLMCCSQGHGGNWECITQRDRPNTEEIWVSLPAV